MVKILSTKSAKPRKDIVGVGDNSKKKHRSRVELVGKYEVDDNEVFDNEVVKARLKISYLITNDYYLKCKGMLSVNG